MIRSSSTPIVDTRIGTSFGDERRIPEPVLFDGLELRRNQPKVVSEGYILSIPSRIDNADELDCYGSDAESETSEITWLTFRVEQMKEKFFREITAKGFMAKATPKTPKQERRVSKMTDIGVLDVDFGMPTSVEEEASLGDELDALVGLPTASGCSAPKISSNKNQDSHDSLLLNQIIDLKLQLAHKQAAIDKLKSKCKELELENDHLKIRSKKLAQVAELINEDGGYSSTFRQDQEKPYVAKTPFRSNHKMIDKRNAIWNRCINNYEEQADKSRLGKTNTDTLPKNLKASGSSLERLLESMRHSIRGEINNPIDRSDTSRRSSCFLFRNSDLANEEKGDPDKVDARRKSAGWLG